MIDLTTLTEEELFNLRDRVIDRIDEIRKTGRNEEVQRLRDKYEGKCFVDPETEAIIRVDKITSKYSARVWKFAISFNEDDSFSAMMFYCDPHMTGLFLPQLDMNGKIVSASYLSRCDEISWEDAKKLIYKNFNQIRKEFLGLDDAR